MKKFLLLSLVLFTVLLSGCFESGGDSKKEVKISSIILKTDKEEIAANGNDSLTLSSKILDDQGKEIKDQVVSYFLDDTILDGNTFKTIKTGEYKFKAKSGLIGSSVVVVKAKQAVSKIEITSSSIDIYADGNDSVELKTQVFDFEGNEIKDAKLEFSEGINKLESNIFKTTVPGTYKLTVKSSGISSKEITVTAKELTVSSIEIEANINEIVANNNDSATFSAIVKDIKGNVLKNILVGYYLGETKLSGIDFKTDKSGDYKIVAKIKEVISNTVTIKAVEQKVKTIELTADKLAIIANGVDKVNLSSIARDQKGVTFSGISVDFFNQNVKLSTAEFKTTTDGSYKFTAKYDDITSNEITISASKPKTSKITITTDKNSIVANNLDKAQFSYEVKDSMGVAINDIKPSFEVKFSSNINKLLDSSFATDINGKYEISATADGIVSNIITLDAAKQILSSIVLTTDKTEIAADNKETITMIAVYKDQQGVTMSGITLDYFVNDTKLVENAFKSSTIGAFKLKASYDKITSNEIEIKTNNPADAVVVGRFEIGSRPQLYDTLVLSDGSFIVANDNFDSNIVISRFDSSGNVLKRFSAAHTFGNPVIRVLKNDNILVLYSSYYGNITGGMESINFYDVYTKWNGKIFDKDGNILVKEFLIDNVYLGAAFSLPGGREPQLNGMTPAPIAAVALNNGDFDVFYMAEEHFGTTTTGTTETTPMGSALRKRKFDSKGNFISQSYELNTFETTRITPIISKFTDGSYNIILKSSNVTLQRYDNTGSRIGNWITLSESDKIIKKVVTQDTTLSIFWKNRDSNDLFFQKINSDGTKAGNEILIDFIKYENGYDLIKKNEKEIMCIYYGNNKEGIGQKFDSNGNKIGRTLKLPYEIVQPQNQSLWIRPEVLMGLFLSNGNYSITNATQSEHMVGTIIKIVE